LGATYDAAANVSTIVDPDGREQEYYYNADNQVTTVVWLSSVGGTTAAAT
jgi:YD repeat-containing protein